MVHTLSRGIKSMIYSLFFQSVSLEFIFFLERLKVIMRRRQSFKFQGTDIMEEHVASWCNSIVIITLHFSVYYSGAFLFLLFPILDSGYFYCQGTRGIDLRVKRAKSMALILQKLHLSIYLLWPIPLFCPSIYHYCGSSGPDLAAKT